MVQILLFVVGGLVIILGILKLLKPFYLTLKGYQTTIGKVSESVNEYDVYEKISKENNPYEAMQDSINNYPKTNRSGTFNSLIEYEVAGRKYTTYNPIGASYRDKIGKKYKIKYDPIDPSRAYVVDYAKLFLVILAGAFFVFGGFMVQV